MNDHWVIDATMGYPFCCCPVELDEEGGIKSVVTGLNLIGSPPGRIIAVIHADGDEACEAFCEAHKAELDGFIAANHAEHRYA